MIECNITAATWHGGQVAYLRALFPTPFFSTVRYLLGSRCITQGGRHTVTAVNATYDNKINDGRF